MKKILLWILGSLSALILLAGIGLLAWMGSADFQPLEIERLENLRQTLVIYDAQDQPMADLAGQENRVMVTLDEISPYLPQAFIVTEDARFYDHHGIDPLRIAGALWADLKTGSFAQGASTLTQQLVKLTHLTSEKTLERKIQEAILALQLEEHYTKDEILTFYLNVVYFGNGAYGAEAAARSYFGKPASKLTCAEAALLAGIVKAPSTYAPHIDLEKSLERRDLILGLMHEHGVIDEALYRTSLAEVPKLNLSRPGDYDHGYYVDAAMEEAMELLDMDYEALVSSGFHIHTAMEPWLQEACEQAFADDSLFPADAADGTQVQGAMVFLSAGDGMVRALVGGREYLTRRGFDRSRDALRQPGSTVKPLLAFAPAMELAGLSPATPILDAPEDFDGYRPGNAGGGYRGWITLREALSHSVNIPAVRLMESVGVERAKGYGEAAGLTFDPADTGLALSLGGMTRGISPLTLAGAYTVFADSGIAHTPAMIRSITDAEGREIYRHQGDGRAVFRRDTVFLINDMLRDAAQEGSARAMGQIGIPLCCKTGTVSHEGTVRDLWAAAYNADYVGVCWMGFDEGGKTHSLPDTASGGQYAVPMLARIFGGLYPQGNAPEFTPPLSVVQAAVDGRFLAQGQLCPASPSTPEADRLTDYFRRGTEPTNFG